MNKKDGTLAPAQGQGPETTANYPKPSWRDLYPPHPAAEVFPMLEGAERDALVDDIRAHGVRVEIVLWKDDNKVWTLDGRNRLECADQAGLDLDDLPILWTSPYAVGKRLVKDPIAYVLSANIHRRHLTREQRAEISAYLYREQGWSQAQIAQALHVSQPTVSNDLAGELLVSNNSHPERGGRPRKPKTDPKPKPPQPVVDLEERRRQRELLGLDPPPPPDPERELTDLIASADTTLKGVADRLTTLTPGDVSPATLDALLVTVKKRHIAIAIECKRLS